MQVLGKVMTNAHVHTKWMVFCRAIACPWRCHHVMIPLTAHDGACKPRDICDVRLECETWIVHHVQRLLSLHGT